MKHLAILTTIVLLMIAGCSKSLEGQRVVINCDGTLWAGDVYVDTESYMVICFGPKCLSFEKAQCEVEAVR